MCIFYVRCAPGDSRMSAAVPDWSLARVERTPAVPRSERLLASIQIQELSRHTRARLRSEKLEQLALQDRIDVLARPRTSLESKVRCCPAIMATIGSSTPCSRC